MLRISCGNDYGHGKVLEKCKLTPHSVSGELVDKIKFMSRRFKLLEQALVAEAQVCYTFSLAHCTSYRSVDQRLFSSVKTKLTIVDLGSQTSQQKNSDES